MVDLLAFPFEVQRAILAHCLDVHVTALLQTCTHIHDACLPLLYTDIRLTTLRALVCFVRPTSGAHRHASSWTRSFALNLPGVPGGRVPSPVAPASAPAPAPASENGEGVDPDTEASPQDRLLLAAKAMLLCPLAEAVSIEMYGVRHSPLLTDPTAIDAERTTFQHALAALPRLRRFRWITPESARFVGFSVAVVDQAFAPLVEGLYDAATGQEPIPGDGQGDEGETEDEDEDEEEEEEEEEEWDLQQEEAEEAEEERRLRHESENGQAALALGPWVPVGPGQGQHPLEDIELHHVQFASDRGRRLFSLLGSAGPQGHLFARLSSVTVRSAINVAPAGPAFLALVWELRRSPHVGSSREWQRGGGQEREEAEEARPRRILLADAFISSIWGDRVTTQSIREQVEAILASACDGPTKAEPPSSNSNNPYIRALEESVGIAASRDLKLPAHMAAQLPKLRDWQRQEIVLGAVDRVEILTIEKAIAGSVS